MDKIITIFIADDHPFMRKGLRQVLESIPGIKIVGEAGDGAAALEAIRTQSIDLAVLDIDMPKMSGLDIAKELQREGRTTDIIIMTMYKDEAIFNRAMDSGIKGYVLKENAVVEMIQCIQSVAEGKYYVSPMMSEFLVRRSGRSTLITEKGNSVDDLTAAEKKILKFISENKTSKEIADVLFISPKTVENHRSNICAKLNLHGSHALLKFAIENRMKL